MSGHRILIIDDHPESSDALRRMFERRGGSAVCTRSLAEGLQLEYQARSKGVPFHCVVADLCLPQFNVHETIDALKKLAEVVAVRAWTGAAEGETIEACHAAGIGLILKGTSADGIIESILYAIADFHPTDSTIYAQIAEARSQIREVPFHVSTPPWFRWILNWPSWAKITGMITGTVTVFGSIITVGATVFKTIDSRAIAREAARESSLQYVDRMTTAERRLEANENSVRELQDDRIRIITKLDAQSEQLDRIWRRIDGQPPRP